MTPVFRPPRLSPDPCSPCPEGWTELLADRETGAQALALRALDLASASGLSLDRLAPCFRILAAAHPSMQILRALEGEVMRADSRRVLSQTRRTLRRSNLLIARNFASWLKRDFPGRLHLRIVTLSRSSTVLAALLAAGKRIQEVRFARSLPLGEGRIACREAREAGLRGMVFEDSRLTEEIDRCDLALVGADSLLADGSVVNKVGTRRLAEIAAKRKKPLWVVTSRYKFSESTSSHLFQEVARRKIRLFDATPAKWVARVVTEEPGQIVGNMTQSTGPL